MFVPPRQDKLANERGEGRLTQSPATPIRIGSVNRPYLNRSRRRSRNDRPWPPNVSSNFCVQSQSQHAQGSVPFSCRQLRRECASCTLTSSKYSSQYGRSSASGGSQKQVSTQVATPSLFTRAW